VTVTGAAKPGVPTEGGKGDRTRRRLLELAVERFAREGFRRTSVSDIARDAGLSPAAAYAYYAGKEALFIAAVDHDAGGLIDEARGAKTSTDQVGRLVESLGALSAGLERHPLARRVLGGHEPDVIARLLDLSSLAALRGELADDLRAAQQHGEVRADVDADELAIGIESTVLALLMGIVQADVDDPRRSRGVVAMFEAALTRER
jgi:TetR/AcrR family transcriptional repressor of nem operon